MRTLPLPRKGAAQGGFTLIELLVVVVILGVVAGITYPIVNSGLERRASARAIQSLSDNIQRTTQAIIVATGTVADVDTQHPVANTGNSFLDVLVNGADAVMAGGGAGDFTDEYSDAGVNTLARIVHVDKAPTLTAGAGVPGDYSIRSYAVSIASPTTGEIEVTYTGVPADVIERMAADASDAAWVATGGSAGVLSWTDTTGGTGDLTFTLPI